MDLCCDVFLNFLNSNHLSLSDTDSCFGTLAWFFVMLIRFAMLGTDFLSFVFLSYLNSIHLSLFRAWACDVFLNSLNTSCLSQTATHVCHGVDGLRRGDKSKLENVSNLSSKRVKAYSPAPSSRVC